MFDPEACTRQIYTEALTNMLAFIDLNHVDPLYKIIRADIFHSDASSCLVGVEYSEK